MLVDPDFERIDRGVVPNKKTKKWHAYLIREDGRVLLSKVSHDTAEEAEQALDVWCDAFDKNELSKHG